MGCRIVHDTKQKYAVLYCSTTDWAFGPIFMADDDHDADERAAAFCRWLETAPGWPRYIMRDGFFSIGGRRDARQLSDSGLLEAYGDWRAQEAAQWAAEDAAEAARSAAR